MEDEIESLVLQQQRRLQKRIRQAEHSIGGRVQENYDSAKMREQATTIANKVVNRLSEGGLIINIEVLAIRSFHHIWRVTYCAVNNTHETRKSEINVFALRICKDSGTLNPYQTRNEVACLQFVAKNLPRIPVPIVFAWDDGSLGSEPAFIAESFIQGQQLSKVWLSLTETEKYNISHEIANIMADLAETRFAFIGGITPDFDPGPLIDKMQLDFGRGKFYDPKNYNIGPYKNVKEFVISCYDREIFFWTHTTKEDIKFHINCEYEESRVADFVENLKLECQALVEGKSDALFRSINTEPNVLIHDDFNGNNILVYDGRVVAVLDWGFAGAYPLSEVIAPCTIVIVSDLSCDEKERDIEELKWDKRIDKELRHVVRQRGWSEKDIAALTSWGHPILDKARYFMLPEEETDDT